MAKLAKDSGIPWIGSIPFDWQTVKMKQVADFQPRCDVSGLSADSEITYTPMECIRNGYFVNNTALYGDLPPSLTPYNNGDIVFAKVTPCFENGNIAIMENLNSGFGLGSSELFVVRPRAIGTRFLFYWLQNDAFIQQGRATMTGTGGLKRVSPYFVKNCPLPLPSDKEQQRIANFLDAECARIDAIIEQTRATVEEYKKLKQSIITQAVTKGIRPNRPMKDSGIEWIGEIPEEWEVKKLKYLASYNDETISEATSENFEFDYIDISSVEFGKGIIELQHMKFRDAPSRARRVVKKDDIILSTVRTYLKAVACIKDYCAPLIVSTGFIVLRALKDKVLPLYLYFAVISESFICKVEANSVGISYPAINAPDVVSFALPVPSLEEQELIAHFLNDKCSFIDSIIEKKTTFIEELLNYKKSLIYEYVTGKKEAPL